MKFLPKLFENNHAAPTWGEVWFNLIDTGDEIRKTRRCLVIPRDELNHHLRTVIVAPMTTGGHAYPWRVQWHVQGQSGLIAIDQLRTVDTEHCMTPCSFFTSCRINRY